MIAARRWWALAAVAVGCGDLPALDRTGMVRAGANGECPTGFVARVGRCCPENSSPSSCPRFNGLISTGCSAETQCSQGADVECFPLAGGYCTSVTAGCTAEGATCEEIGVCVRVGMGMNGFLLCARRCDLAAGATHGTCPFRGDGYSCVRHQPSGSGEAFGVCLPTCAFSATNSCAGDARCVPTPVSYPREAVSGGVPGVCLKTCNPSTPNACSSIYFACMEGICQPAANVMPPQACSGVADTSCPMGQRCRVDSVVPPRYSCRP